MRAILKYEEEGWLGKAQNKVNGVIYRSEPDDEAFKRLKDVPSNAILAKIEGSWHDKIYYTIEGEKVCSARFYSKQVTAAN